jgi:hypothetical protein
MRLDIFQMSLNMEDGLLSRRSSFRFGASRETAHKQERCRLWHHNNFVAYFTSEQVSGCRLASSWSTR